LGSSAFVLLLLFIGKGELWTYLGVAFFGLGIVFSIYMLLPGTIRLKVDSSGVEMKTLFKPVKLAWSDVDHFSVQRVPSAPLTKMIGIKYSDSYRKHEAGRKFAASFTGAEGALPDHFNRPAEEICAILNDYKQKYAPRPIDNNNP